MKKLYWTLMFFLVLMFPTFGQSYMQDELVPVENLTLKKGNIPPAIIKTADELFKGNSQINWGIFPYELRDYGWEINKEYDQPINHYEIHLLASDGSNVWAVFESTGELISYRLTRKDMALPAAVQAAVAKSEYKDWTMTGNVWKIRNNQKKGVEHYSVTLTKGNQKKTLYFTTQGGMLMNK